MSWPKILLLEVLQMGIALQLLLLLWIAGVVQKQPAGVAMQQLAQIM